jgi:hypothetical protein
MSKNANLTTLRKRSLQSIILLTSNNKSLASNLQLLKNLIYLFQRKGYYILKAVFLKNIDICKLNLTVFVTSKNISKYLKHHIKSKNIFKESLTVSDSKIAVSPRLMERHKKILAIKSKRTQDLLYYRKVLHLKKLSILSNYSKSFARSTYVSKKYFIKNFNSIMQACRFIKPKMDSSHEIYQKHYGLKCFGVDTNSARLENISINANNLFNKYLFTKNILIKLTVLNKYIKRGPHKFFNKIMKRYKKVLFIRRYLFYKDFIKVLSILYRKNVHAATITQMFSRLFKFLPKKRHSMFIKFTKLISRTLSTFRSKRLTNNRLTAIKGIKVRLNGRLRGKPRATTHFIIQGNIPNQTIESNLEYGFEPIFTPRYGAFGLHMWILK